MRWIFFWFLASVAFANEVGVTSIRCREGNSKLAALPLTLNDPFLIKEIELKQYSAAVDRFIAKNFPGAQMMSAGGESMVFRYKDPSGREFVIKVPREPDPRIEPAYRKELELTNRLRESLPDAHRIVKSEEVGKDGEIPYLKMRMVPGKTFQTEMMTLGPQTDPRLMLSIMRKITLGLKRVHDSGYVHYDVKPSNIQIEGGINAANARAVLLDFGQSVKIGDRTEYGENKIAGTIGFLSPNKLEGGPPAVGDDIYALSRTFQLALIGMRHPQDFREARKMGDSKVASTIEESPYKTAVILKLPVGPKYEILSTLAYHPWQSADELLEAQTWAGKALEPDSKVDFYRDYYGPKVFEPLAKRRVFQALEVLRGAEEVNSRFLRNTLGLSAETQRKLSYP